jgi:hypothetical protein
MVPLSTSPEAPPLDKQTDMYKQVQVCMHLECNTTKIVYTVFTCIRVRCNKPSHAYSCIYQHYAVLTIVQYARIAYTGSV